MPDRAILRPKVAVEPSFAHSVAALPYAPIQAGRRAIPEHRRIAGMASRARPWPAQRRRCSALPTTDTELKDMAAAAQEERSDECDVGWDDWLGVWRVRLLVCATIVLKPSCDMRAARIMVCPVNHATLGIPLVLAVELYCISVGQAYHPGRQVDVVRDQECLA